MSSPKTVVQQLTYPQPKRLEPLAGLKQKLFFCLVRSKSHRQI